MRGVCYRSSKFRHVYGKPASKEKCYDCVPITCSVHDNHFCAVNPHFIAVVTECAGGGAFLVIPIHQTGKLDPHYPRVCGHRGNVLDIKWSPFDDFVIASCSEDATVKIWDIPKHLLTRNITSARKELLGHARRVGLIEWHPTASNIIFSTAGAKHAGK
uniref:Coronin n=1 Tax=Gopherus evgoodei TaxID=1825980 RepID=A0A8C4YN86_9SAUR